MSEQPRKRRHSGSIFRHLTVTVTVAIFVLVITLSGITSWITAQRLEARAITEATHLTKHFAAQSVFMLLADDPSLHEQSLSMMKAFPGIEYVGVYGKNYRQIAQKGQDIHWYPDVTSTANAERKESFYEDNTHWHFVHPIETKPEPSPVHVRDSKPELLGYLQIGITKAPLKNLIKLTVLSTFLISLLFAFFLIGWLAKRMRRLTDPLSDLATTMVQINRGTNKIRASLVGPDEVRYIGRAFNELMDEIDQHKKTLESKVAIRTEELKQARDTAFSAIQHKNEFMAAVTHEMRSPLHSIAAYVQLTLNELELIKNPTISNNPRQYQGIILSEANKLLNRINQILELARTEAGKTNIKRTRVNLITLITHIEKTIKPLADQNKNVLSIVHDGLEEAFIDEDKLQQIMLNLLTNACKFTQNGIVTMQCSCRQDLMSLIVKDTGIGIPLEEQPFVFEPFRQVDMSHTRKHQGTGLGLAITQRFCELLGGQIRLTSEIGQGSVFTVDFPILPESDIVEIQDRGVKD